jgi:hypothetical protein
MQVELFHQILIWPLRVEAPGMEKGEWMDGLEKLFQEHSPWKTISDLYETGMDAPSIQYAEFVYFHPFVQDFLFSKNAAKAIRMMQRTDVAKMHVQLKDSSHLLNVLRARLYMVRTGIILLVIELCGKHIELMALEDLTDSVRRAYPPYWNHEGQAGHCPVEVKWLASSGQEMVKSNYGEMESHIKFVHEHRHPPVSRHWQWLLEPLKNDGSTVLTYSHIEDERIPSMCYFAFSDPAKLTNGDFLRLGSLGEHGDPSTLPYAALFSQDFQEKCCYDRFWDPTTPGHEWMTTRYLCTGYSFVMLGKMGPFFSDAENGALAHFRHHYFQFGLIAQLQQASLLVFSSRLAAAVTDYSESYHRAKLYDKIEQLVLDIADFTARFRFDEVSNQIQGQELFNLWYEQLGTRKLFQQVMDETRFVQQVHADYQRDRQTKAATKLTSIGAYGVPLSLLIAIAIGISPYLAPHARIYWGWADWESWTLALVSALCLGGAIGFILGKTVLRRSWN